MPPDDDELSRSGDPGEHPGLTLVAWALLRIGAVAFGGLGATLALLNRDLVERRGWLLASDVTEALAYTKPLPGSTVVQVVTFLGWRLGRWPGAIVATIMFLIPAFAIMTTVYLGFLLAQDEERKGPAETEDGREGAHQRKGTEANGFMASRVSRGRSKGPPGGEAGKSAAPLSRGSSLPIRGENGVGSRRHRARSRGNPAPLMPDQPG